MSTRPDARDDLQDPKLAQWYRESGGPEPSPALDQAILAAAHREVLARPRAAGSTLRRWRVPLSLAAVVVLSVTVVTLVTEHGGELADSGAPLRLEERAPQVPDAIPTQPEKGEGAPAASAERAAPGALAKRRSDEFVPPPAAPTAAAPAPAQSGQGERAPPPQDARRERGAAERPSREPFPGPTEAQTSAAQGLSTGASGAAGSAPYPGLGQSEDARPAASARDDSAPAAPRVASPSASQAHDSAVVEQRSLAKPQAAAKPMPPGGELTRLLKELEHQPPERWLEKIEELRRAGRNAEGDELLAEFRKRFPEHPGAARR